MLNTLLNLTNYEDMRIFVQDLNKQGNITELIKNMKKQNIIFTLEIINNSHINDYDFISKLTEKTCTNASLLCYYKLNWIIKTNPVISLKITKVMEMFKE